MGLVDLNSIWNSFLALKPQEQEQMPLTNKFYKR